MSFFVGARPSVPFINVVTDYKADPTEQSDSWFAFKSAIDEANRTGRSIYVPSGSYRLDAPLPAILRVGIIIRGEGKNSTILRANFTFGNTLTIGGNGFPYESTSTTQLTIGTGNQTLTVSPNLGYDFLTTADLRNSQKVKISNPQTGFFMTGNVVSYVRSTGELTIDSSTTVGTGTYGSWKINLDNYLNAYGQGQFITIEHMSFYPMQAKSDGYEIALSPNSSLGAYGDFMVSLKDLYINSAYNGILVRDSTDTIIQDIHLRYLMGPFGLKYEGPTSNSLGVFRSTVRNVIADNPYPLPVFDDVVNLPTGTTPGVGKREYAANNYYGFAANGTITGTVLTINDYNLNSPYGHGGNVRIGQLITGPGVINGTMITGRSGGSTGGVGTYNINLDHGVNRIPAGTGFITVKGYGDVFTGNNWLWQTIHPGNTGTRITPPDAPVPTAAMKNIFYNGQLPYSSTPFFGTGSISSNVIAGQTGLPQQLWAIPICHKDLTWIYIEDNSNSIAIKGAALINGNTGLRMDSSTEGITKGLHPRFVIVDGLETDHPYWAGVELERGLSFQYTNGWAGSTLVGNGITIANTFKGEVTISNSRITRNGANGIFIGGAFPRSTIINNNLIQQNGVNDDLISNPSRFAAIAAAPGAREFIITNNITGNDTDVGYVGGGSFPEGGRFTTQNTGISIATTCNNYIIIGNLYGGSNVRNPTNAVTVHGRRISPQGVGVVLASNLPAIT